MKGIDHGKGKSYGSLDDTVILIEADESTPLLVDRRLLVDNGDGNNNNDIGRLKRLSIWSFASKSPSQSSDGGVSTKSFRSHFGELKVMAFALLLIAGLSIAIYLLIIESRLPSITFSLDLVHHDAWSVHKLPMGQQLNPHNVDSVIVTQTGSQNCDNPRECMHALQQMQDDYSYANNEELPYNFVIGCEGVAFEVRGWNYESGMMDVDQAHTLVIGIMGNFDFFPPSQEILQTVRFLIIESMKRHKLMRSHQVLGLNTFCADCQDGEPLLK